jgi:hypothetical protein
MLGKTKIIVNESTMIAAAQLYLDSIMIKGKVPRVVSINQIDMTFEIEAQGPESDVSREVEETWEEIKNASRTK